MLTAAGKPASSYFDKQSFRDSLFIFAVLGPGQPCTAVCAMRHLKVQCPDSNCRFRTLIKYPDARLRSAKKPANGTEERSFRELWRAWGRRQRGWRFVGGTPALPKKQGSVTIIFVKISESIARQVIRACRAKHLHYMPTVSPCGWQRGLCCPLFSSSNTSFTAKHFHPKTSCAEHHNALQKWGCSLFTFLLPIGHFCIGMIWLLHADTGVIDA